MNCPELPINPPDPEKLPVCPKCGKELGTYDQVYISCDGEYLGCDLCIVARFADDYFTE